MNFSAGIVWLVVAKWCASTASCRLYGLLMTRIQHSGAEQAVSLYVNCFLAETNSSRNSLILCGRSHAFLYFCIFCLCGCSHALTEERGERKTKAQDEKGKKGSGPDERKAFTEERNIFYKGKKRLTGQRKSDCPNGAVGVDKDNDNGSCKRLEQIGTTMASIATSIYKKEIL